MTPAGALAIGSRHLLWRRILDDKSNEFFELRADATSATMTGWIVAEHGGSPALITYRIATTPDLTRARVLDVVSRVAGSVRQLRIEARSSSLWRVDGAHRAELDGCTDVDLEWSPATNLFPIRRLMLAQDDHDAALDVRAVWVRMPHLAVEPAPQRYTRMRRDRFRYQSLGSDFSAELEVDDLGLPISYAGIWQAIAQWRST